MGRRNRRGTRPELEAIEGRVLLSSITDVLSSNSATLAGHRGHAVPNLAGGGGGGGAGAGGGQGSGSSSSPNFASSINIGGSTLTQGPVLNPDGSINNMALAPTGTPKPGQLRRQRFTGHFSGPYTIVPGRFNTQAAQVLIQGGGTSTTMLHSDIQIRIVQPNDPSLPFGGAGTIFDRNINSNSALGFDISTAQQRGNLDRAGRPTHFSSVSVDINASAGTYVEAYGQGTMTIRYLPSGKKTAGIISQGTAIVTVHMNIYAPATSYLLRNVGLNP